MASSATAAVLTVIVARRIAKNQNDLQQALAGREDQFKQAQLDQQTRQLAKDLFDRRFETYLGVRDFLRYVVSAPDEIKLLSPQFMTFRDHIEKAEMLFGAEVHEYMMAVRKQATKLYVAQQGLRSNPNDSRLIDEQANLMNELSEILWKQRQIVFRPYLGLG